MNRSYLIAEIGNNHNGSLEKAIQLIDASADAGADAVKFQSFRGIDIVSPTVRADEYKGWDVKGHEFWFQFLDTIALPLEDHQKVIDHTLKRKMDFITTPTSPAILSELEKLMGIKAYKVASMDVTNIPLLQAMAATRKEIILSTGMSAMHEVKKAVSIFGKHTLSILHCVSDYPLDPNKAYLHNIQELQKEFPQTRVGFSDHSFGHELCIAARCLGALVFEKHITLDRKDPNPAEHHFSMEPNEFKDLCSWLRAIDHNLNDKAFSRSETELVNKFKYRRSYHYAHDLQKGEIVQLKDLSFVRPGEGLTYEELDHFLGKKLTRNVSAFKPCSLKDIQ